MNFQAAARAITGSKDKQEDAWRVYDLKGDVGGVARSDVGTAVTGGGLMLVADGIGGHHGGEVASKITADTFVKSFFSTSGNPEDRLRKALNDANAAIADAQAKEPALKDMGATLVAGFFEGDRMSFVSVGDSLIYRYRDGELHRVNMDHSYFEIADREALGKDDRNLWKEVISRKGRDSITIAVLGRALEDFGHSPQIATRKVLPGDVMIFSSDGLETLSPVQIHNFIRELLPHGVGKVADGLIKAVDGIGGNRNYQDNATLVVLQADGGAPVSTTKITHSESAKTAPVAAAAPKTEMIPPKAEAPKATAAPGTISAGARSGKWSPTKFLLPLFVLVLIAAAAVLYTLGTFGPRAPQDAKKSLPTPDNTTNVTPPAEKNAAPKVLPRQGQERQQQTDQPPQRQEKNAPGTPSPSPSPQNYQIPLGQQRAPVIIHLRDGGPMWPADEVDSELYSNSNTATPRYGYSQGGRYYAPYDRYARYRSPYDCE